MTRFIYILTENEIPIYVGKTNNIIKRTNNHKKKYPNAKLDVIDEVKQSEWKFWESHYISLYKSWGFKLKNKNNGGGGIDGHTIETKLKLSKLHKGKIVSEETKKKISDAGKNRVYSKERNEKISKAHKGHHRAVSEETKKKISQTLKGNIPWNKGLKIKMFVGR
jgi:NUMOD3 motif-containing protein